MRTWLSSWDKTEKCRAPLMTGFPLEFLSLRFVHMESPEIHQLHQIYPTRFSYPATGSTEASAGFCLWVSAKSWCSVSVCVYLSFQFEGQWFAQWPPFSDGSKNSCWFFQFLQLFYFSSCFLKWLYHFIFTKSLESSSSSTCFPHVVWSVCLILAILTEE